MNAVCRKKGPNSKTDSSAKQGPNAQSGAPQSKNAHSKRNKVIKSHASAISKKVRHTDRQTFFFCKKTFEMAVYPTKFLLLVLRDIKTREKAFKRVL